MTTALYLTRFFVQTYVYDRARRVMPGMLYAADSEAAARRRAEKIMASKCAIGVRVFSEAGNPQEDEYEAPVALGTYGKVPAID